MNRIATIVLLASIGLVGCKSTANKDYQALMSNNNVINTNQDAIKKSTPVSLNTNQKLETKILLTDPVIQFDNSRSNFKVFRFSGKQGSKYQLELRSYCDCLGFNKTIMHPIGYLMNSNGDVVNSQPNSLKQGSGMHVNIQGIWQGTLPSDDDYYFLVAADNRMLGNTSVEAVTALPTAPYMPISIPISNDIKGEIVLKLSLN